jgi:hypothetical protein
MPCSPFRVASSLGNLAQYAPEIVLCLLHTVVISSSSGICGCKNRLGSCRVVRPHDDTYCRADCLGGRMSYTPFLLHRLRPSS